MLSAADDPIIRRAIMRRLDKENGIRVLEVKVADHPYALPPYIAVGILTHVDDKSIGRHNFHLEIVEDNYQQLINEIDQIAEQCKKERRRFRLVGLPQLGAVSEEITAIGTGLRGLWTGNRRRMQ